MRVIVANPRLAAPGGSETYALTIAEHLARLGHEVLLFAPTVGEPVAGWAHRRSLMLLAEENALPEATGALITNVDPGLSLRLAARYPSAVHLFVPHSEEDRFLPPPLPGAVSATIALSERQRVRAAARPGAGEVVRLRQPIDLALFAPRRPPAEPPRVVLLLGNYHGMRTGRAAEIKDAWGTSGMEWRQLGADKATLDVAPVMAQADIVVGYGRAALEGMASGRPVYVHDHSGTEGWVSADAYEALEAGGFAVSERRRGRTASDLRADLREYSPDLGRIGHELVRAHHDARQHAAELVALVERLRPASAEPAAEVLRDRALRHALLSLIDAQMRAEGIAESTRLELRQLHEAHDALSERTEQAERRLRQLQGRPRYRIMDRVMRPLDRLRGR